MSVSAMYQTECHLLPLINECVFLLVITPNTKYGIYPKDQGKRGKYPGVVVMPRHRDESGVCPW